MKTVYIIVIVVIALLTSSFYPQEEQIRKIDYCVKDGDTLHSICAKHISEKHNLLETVYNTIHENGIENGGLIIPGQKITIVIHDN